MVSIFICKTMSEVHSKSNVKSDIMGAHIFSLCVCTFSILLDRTYFICFLLTNQCFILYSNKLLLPSFDLPFHRYRYWHIPTLWKRRTRYASFLNDFLIHSQSLFFHKIWRLFCVIWNFQYRNHQYHASINSYTKLERLDHSSCLNHSISV